MFSLQYLGNNRSGIRSLVSILWNVSTDIYSYEYSNNKDVGWLRVELDPYLRAENPDCVDLVDLLLSSVSSCSGDVLLKNAIPMMNL